MNGQKEALLEGAILGIVASERDYRRRRDDDSRYTLNVSQDALGSARQALSDINALVNNGDIIRLGVATVADLLSGLAYGGSLEAEAPNPLPTAPSALPRPVITEALAVAPQQWPPSSNGYDNKGNLTRPGEWLEGQNAALGLVLGFAELRAFLLGLPGPAHPDSFVQAQFFRAAHGLSNAMRRAGALSTPLTQAQYDSAWARLFGLQPGVPVSTSGLIYVNVADGATVANTTTETELIRLTWPAGLLAVGEAAEVVFGEVIAGNSTLTGRVRLDTAVGTTLAELDVVVTTAKTQQHRLVITRRADVGGNEVYNCLSDASGVAVTRSVSFAPGVDHALLLTGEWGAAAVGNTTTGALAMLRKL